MRSNYISRNLLQFTLDLIFLPIPALIPRLEKELDIFGFSDVQLKQATLSWQLVKPSDYRYVLEMKPPDRDWETIVENIEAQTYNVQNLIPEEQYEFRLTALTKQGLVSEPTQPLVLEPRKGLNE